MFSVLPAAFLNHFGSIIHHETLSRFIFLYVFFFYSLFFVFSLLLPLLIISLFHCLVSYQYSCTYLHLFRRLYFAACALSFLLLFRSLSVTSVFLCLIRCYALLIYPWSFSYSSVFSSSWFSSTFLFFSPFLLSASFITSLHMGFIVSIYISPVLPPLSGEESATAFGEHSSDVF